MTEYPPLGHPGPEPPVPPMTPVPAGSSVPPEPQAPAPAPTPAPTPARVAEAPAHDEVRSRLVAVHQEVAKVVVGQLDVLAGMMCAILARGHVMLEGVRGVG